MNRYPNLMIVILIIGVSISAIAKFSTDAYINYQKGVEIEQKKIVEKKRQAAMCKYLASKKLEIEADLKKPMGDYNFKSDNSKSLVIDTPVNTEFDKQMNEQINANLRRNEENYKRAGQTLFDVFKGQELERRQNRAKAAKGIEEYLNSDECRQEN